MSWRSWSCRPIVEIVCAVNLQYLKEIFTEVWAFAIANDAGNNARLQLQNYLVEKQQVVYSIKEVGGFVRISMDELRSSGKANDMETYDNIVSTIAIFSLQIVAGISKVCVERDNQNYSADQLPPVLPHDCAIYISETLLLLCNSNWSALSKVFGCGG